MKYDRHRFWMRSACAMLVASCAVSSNTPATSNADGKADSAGGPRGLLARNGFDYVRTEYWAIDSSQDVPSGLTCTADTCYVVYQPDQTEAAGGVDRYEHRDGRVVYVRSNSLVAVHPGRFGAITVNRVSLGSDERLRSTIDISISYGGGPVLTAQDLVVAEDETDADGVTWFSSGGLVLPSQQEIWPFKFGVDPVTGDISTESFLQPQPADTWASVTPTFSPNVGSSQVDVEGTWFIPKAANDTCLPDQGVVVKLVDFESAADRRITITKVAGVKPNADGSLYFGSSSNVVTLANVDEYDRVTSVATTVQSYGWYYGLYVARRTLELNPYYVYRGDEFGDVSPDFGEFGNTSPSSSSPAECRSVRL